MPTPIVDDYDSIHESMEKLNKPKIEICYDTMNGHEHECICLTFCNVEYFIEHKQNKVILPGLCKRGYR